MKNITPAQAIVLVACLTAMVVANKLLGSEAATMIVGTVGMLVNFLLGRDPPPPPASQNPLQPTQLSLFEGDKK